MSKERSIKTLPLDGGALPFHFINTVYAWKGTNLHEYLGDYNDILEWGEKVKLQPRPLLTKLKSYSKLYPKQKEAAFMRLKEIRFLLYQLFSGIANKRTQGSILEAYNLELHQALIKYDWRKAKKGVQLTLQDNPTDLLLPAYIVLKQSHDLLINENFDRIKECPLCGWIFLDNTKNNKRRWCNPATCGSVEKTSRYYQKNKKYLYDDKEGKKK